MKKLIYIILLIVLTSCGTYSYCVKYFSIKHAPGHERDNKSITEPSISMLIALSSSANINTITIINHTDSTMTIDKTQSFVNNSTIYDPEITVKSSSSYSSKGSSLNVGALTGALGLRGPLQGLLSGVSVGKSDGLSNTTTTYDADAPIVHIPPHGRITFDRTFDIIWPFSVCIAYSTNRGKSYKNLITKYIKTDMMSYDVPQEGRKFNLNQGLRNMLLHKPDLLLEDNFIIHATWTDLHTISKNILYDYQ